MSDWKEGSSYFGFSSNLVMKQTRKRIQVSSLNFIIAQGASYWAFINILESSALKALLSRLTRQLTVKSSGHESWGDLNMLSLVLPFLGFSFSTTAFWADFMARHHLIELFDTNQTWKVKERFCWLENTNWGSWSLKKQWLGKANFSYGLTSGIKLMHGGFISSALPIYSHNLKFDTPKW